jgi:hypothetical protein
LRGGDAAVVSIDDIEGIVDCCKEWEMDGKIDGKNLKITIMGQIFLVFIPISNKVRLSLIIMGKIQV